jgi:ABC-type transport system involved in multi-copper enzyme maturation permease subunit
MISIYNILTVARFEAKTLLRSWFYRIFSILSILFIGFWDFGALSPVTWAPWAFQGVSTTIPYMNILLLNAAQAIIAVFLASDFLKRDKNLDTTEVVYMRSMTNNDYVVGKTLGIMSMFLLLNIVILLIGLIFNVFFTETTFAGIAYLIYPVVISIPTLIFILGFAFFMMVTIRNQAVTFIVLLGYIGITLFYLGPKVHNVFDYIAFNVPMVYSHFTGFADMTHMLVQRSIYLLLGLSFIFMTITMIRRLPQSRVMTGMARFGGVACAALAIVLIVVYTGRDGKARSQRERIMAASEAAAGKATATPLSCSIDLKHKGGLIEATAQISVRNDTGTPLSAYIFSLNPGLAVQEVTGSSADLKYERDEHILMLIPATPLAAGAEDSFSIRWRGIINEDALYTDIDEKTLSAAYRLLFFNVGRRYSYIDPSYVLLTPETIWYPVAGPGFVPSRPLERRHDFIDFSLDVTTTPGLTAVSQGASTSASPGRFSFRPENPLPAISLAISEFERQTTVVDSIEYNIYCGKGHNYWSENFSELGDTLEAMIRDLKQTYENNLNLEYPFPRFSIVEVPVHYSAFYHAWSMSQETVQPEMVLIPERGITTRTTDFRRMQRRTERMNERSNEDVSEKETQAGWFAVFVNGTLTGRFGRPDWNSDDPFLRSPSFNVFPNMLTFRNSIDSRDMPWLSMAVESWYAGKLEDNTFSFTRMRWGMTLEERVNLKLAEMSLRDLVLDPEYRKMSHYALKSKGSYLFTRMESAIDRDKLEAAFGELFEEYIHGNVPGDVFVSTMRDRFGIDFPSLARGWYDSISLPGFVVSPVEIYKFIDDEHERYQVRISVTNNGDSNGLMELTFRQMDMNMRGGRRFGMMRMMTATMTMGEDYSKFVTLDAGETKDLGFVLDFQPSSVNINTLVSRNLPATIEIDLPENLEEKKKVAAFEGERSREKPVQMSLDGEIVVDNEDPGFSFESGKSKSLLKRLIPRPGGSAEDTKYVGMRLWDETNMWQPSIDSKFYGDQIRSAHFISGGSGDLKATFAVDMKKSGHYDIYYHVSRITSPWRRRRRSEDEDYGKHHFLIYHDDGVEETELDLNSADDGWNYLGSYYISEGEAKIELTNESEGRVVIADAVKWVAR